MSNQREIDYDNLRSWSQKNHYQLKKLEYKKMPLDKLIEASEDTKNSFVALESTLLDYAKEGCFGGASKIRKIVCIAELRSLVEYHRDSAKILEECLSEIE